MFFVGVEHKAVSLEALFANSRGSGDLVTFKKTRNFGVGKESVHTLQDIRFVRDLFTRGTSTPKDGSEILIKVFSDVLVGHLDREDRQSGLPRRDPLAKGTIQIAYFSTSADANQKRMPWT